MSILIFVIILVVLVVSHEFGHFIVAKKSGIRVDEFSFGFPPKLFGFKKGETTYNFNALPFGGYVKIYGENVEEADMLEVGFLEKDLEAKQKLSRSLIHKPKYIQAMVLLGGVVMNFLVAWLLLSVGFMSGLPTSVSSLSAGEKLNNQALTVTSVVAGSPAELAGLKVGDKIFTLKTANDTTETPSTESVQYFIKRNADKVIDVSFVRAQQKMETKVTPKLDKESGNPMIGISMDVIGTLKLPIHKAIWEGLKLSVDVTSATFVGFYNLIHDAIIGQGNMSAMTGPIGIVGIVGDAAKFGFVYLLSLTALISINLAVINFLPFPALDGGRLLFLLIEKIKGSRINPKVANIVNTIGFGIIILLMVFITYHDVVKLF